MQCDFEDILKCSRVVLLVMQMDWAGREKTSRKTKEAKNARFYPGCCIGIQALSQNEIVNSKNLLFC